MAEDMSYAAVDEMDAEETPLPVASVSEDKKPSKRNKAIAKHFRKEIDAAIKETEALVPQWKRNVQARLGQPGPGSEGVDVDGEVQSEINPDWSLTKTKMANLFSQVPHVQLSHENEAYAGALYPFGKALNYEIGPKRSKVGVAMEEAQADAVNAAGMAVVRVCYAARFVEKDVPEIDLSILSPELREAAINSGQIPMKKQSVPVDTRFPITRVSPSNALWPKSFTGSDFDDAPWVGERGKMPWAEAKHEFHLKDEDKDKVLGAGDRRVDESLQETPDRADQEHLEEVSYEDIYYWRYKVDPDEPSFKSIWRLVYVKGMEPNVPVIHEPWKGQKYNDKGYYVGACKYPLRFLTLTYISDNAVPPSDTQAGAPQVADMRLSRAQMFKNRKYSTPMRWFDVNRIGPQVRDSLLDGTYQGMIPTNGDGSRSIGEVARASYPAEDLAFDRQVKADLAESWRISPAQAGIMQQGERTKAETELVQQNFNVGMTPERVRVTNFFLGIVEVVAGLMALYSDFPSLSTDEIERIKQTWDRENVLHDIAFKVLPDSTIALDTEQKIARTMRLLNMTAASGLTDPTPLIAELYELHGYDPNKHMKPPVEKKPESPNVSIRFAGKEDLFNPGVAGILMKADLLPDPEAMKAAKAFLADAALPLEATPQAGQAPPPMQGPGGMPSPDAAGTPPNPDWNMMPKIAQRSADMGQV